MMRTALINKDTNIVENIIVAEQGYNPQDYIGVVSEIAEIGDLYENGEFVKPALSVQQQIEALENSVTKRNLRAAIAGDEVALNKIAEVEAQIAELRKLL